MNRGPAKNSRATTDFRGKAISAWGDPLPDWVGELVALAEAEGLGGAEKRVGYSRSAISTIIAGKYRGDLGRVEEMVRGSLMAETVECPILGAMARNVCLDWQKRPYTDISALHIRMHRACRACPNSRSQREVGHAD